MSFYYAVKQKIYLLKNKIRKRLCELRRGDKTRRRFETDEKVPTGDSSESVFVQCVAVGAGVSQLDSPLIGPADAIAFLIILAGAIYQGSQISKGCYSL